MTKIRKSYRQKSWWWNMNNIIKNYWHRGEEGDLYLCHMQLPKLRIDRMGPYCKVWAWR